MSKKPTSARPKRLRYHIHGLFPRNYPRSVSWRVDVDYTDQLTPKEKEWLADFLDQHYGANFSRPNRRIKFPREMRRAAYREKNYANDDYYAKCPPELQGVWNPECFDSTSKVDPDAVEDAYARSLLLRRRVDPPGSNGDHSPTPEYLESEEYKAARDAFRDHLDPTRHQNNPKDTRAYRRAKAALAAVTPKEIENDGTTEN